MFKISMVYNIFGGTFHVVPGQFPSKVQREGLNVLIFSLGLI